MFTSPECNTENSSEANQFPDATQDVVAEFTERLTAAEETTKRAILVFRKSQFALWQAIAKGPYQMYHDYKAQPQTIQIRIQQSVNEALRKTGAITQKKTEFLERLVKLNIFGQLDYKSLPKNEQDSRRSLSTSYGQVLRQAEVHSVMPNELADWIKENGGIDNIRSGRVKIGSLSGNNESSPEDEDGNYGDEGDEDVEGTEGIEDVEGNADVEGVEGGESQSNSDPEEEAENQPPPPKETVTRSMKLLRKRTLATSRTLEKLIQIEPKKWNLTDSDKGKQLVIIATYGHDGSVILHSAVPSSSAFDAALNAMEDGEEWELPSASDSLQDQGF